MLSKIIQIVWAFTAVLSFFISTKNYIAYKNFDHRVIVPFFIGLFCVYLFFNIKRQIKNIEKRKSKQE